MELYHLRKSYYFGRVKTLQISGNPESDFLVKTLQARGQRWLRRSVKTLQTGWNGQNIANQNIANQIIVGQNIAGQSNWSKQC